MPTIRARRALPPRSLVLPATAALLVALAGCSDTPAIPDADPTPSASPLFASEEEALEAATAVYEEFLSTTGTILQEGGQGAEKLEPLVSGPVFDQENEGFEQLLETGGRTSGQNRLAGVKLQQLSLSGPDTFELQAYMCVDNSETRLLSGDGTDVTNPNRVEVGTFDVVFVSNPDGSLIIDRKVYWADGDQCAA